MTASAVPLRPVTGPAPLIGITGPRLASAQVAPTPEILLHGRSDVHYASYPASLAAVGALPVHLPREAAPRELVRRLDGLVVAGGQDVDPQRYGARPTATSTLLDPGRDAFEAALIEAALEQRVPLVGVCRGAQLLNLVCGGTLIGDFEPDLAGAHAMVLYPPEHAVHEVRLQPGSRMHAILGDEVAVNSFHHQGIGRCGDGVRATGHAPDGVIEAIEVDGAPAIGVQWHPEMLPGPSPVFEWLVAAATSDRAAERRERSVCP